MQSTIDLPEDPHDDLRRTAHAKRQTLSQTVTELIRRGMAETVALVRDDQIGRTVVDLGGPLTAAEVEQMLDDE